MPKKYIGIEGGFSMNVDFQKVLQKAEEYKVDMSRFL